MSCAARPLSGVRRVLVLLSWWVPLCATLGTGATAAAFAARTVAELDDAVTVALPGGELLIEFDETGAWMTGPATIVFRGSLD